MIPGLFTGFQRHQPCSSSFGCFAYALMGNPGVKFMFRIDCSAFKKEAQFDIDAGNDCVNKYKGNSQLNQKSA